MTDTEEREKNKAIIRDLAATMRLVDMAVKKERKRCYELAMQYADVEGDSESLRPNIAMRIASQIDPVEF